MIKPRPAANAREMPGKSDKVSRTLGGHKIVAE